MVEPDGIEPTT